MTGRSSNGTAYDVTGGDDRPVVVLVHGLGLTRDTWGEIGPALARNFRVVTYDLFGHGESDRPPATPTLTLLSRQLSSLLDELEIPRAAIVGFSLGGMINRRLAMDEPDRVTALVIMNSPHERGTEEQQLVEERARESADGGPAATIDSTLERWFTPAFRQARSEAVDAVRDRVLANDPVTYGQNRWVLANGVVELIRPDPPIDRPTLIMTSENDTGSTPAMSHAIAAEIEGAETVIVPDLQHLGLLEQPRAFTDPITDFLLTALAPIGDHEAKASRQ